MESVAVDRLCLREPIPDIADAARLLDAAVTAHLMGERDLAERLIRLADMPVLRDYTESLWGAKSPYVQYRAVADAPAHLEDESRAKERMPTPAEKVALFQRDGYHCRFCGIPVIRKEVRERIRKVYPDALRWGAKNAEQHAAFQLMWATYDHVLPHSRGGPSDLRNTIIVCQPCNCARMHYTLHELGLLDPRLREPTRSAWDGLERFH
jgi:5-methylcytosine-specific restriction endonuclease McrA